MKKQAAKINFAIEMKCMDGGQMIDKVTAVSDTAFFDSITENNLAGCFQITGKVISPINPKATVSFKSAEISKNRKTAVLTPADDTAYTNFPSTFAVTLTTQGKSFLGEAVNLSITSLTDSEADKWEKCPAPSDGTLYRLFVPDMSKYNKQKSYPLIVLIHGAMEVDAADNHVQLVSWRVPAFASDEIQDIFGGLYVIAPRISGANKTPEKIIATIEDAIKNNPKIDRNRIYIGGASLGGLCTWMLLLKYPGYFAAAFPMSALISYRNGEIGLNNKDMPFIPGADLFTSFGTAASIAHIPIYIIHCIYDFAVDANLAIEIFNGMKAAGATKTHITLFNSVRTREAKDLDTHWASINAFNNFPTILPEGGYVEDFYTGGLVEPKTYSPIPGIELKGPRKAFENAFSELPTDFGYKTFFHWIADQKR